MARRKRRVVSFDDVSPSTRCIAATDLGGNCGWALYDNGRIISGVWKLTETTTKKRNERPGMRFERFFNRLAAIDALDTTDPCQDIYYEEVHAHIGTDAAHAYGGFRATLMHYCESKKKRYGSFGVGTIKKRATGKGNAKKPQMIASANKAFRNIIKRPVIDDNEADALWILILALEKHKLPLPKGFIR